MKKPLSCILFSLILHSFTAGQSLDQNVIASSGGVDFAAGIQLAWTMGEPAIDSYVGASRIFTEGFNQPSAIQAHTRNFLSDSFQEFIKESPDRNLHFSLYPNPASSFVRIIPDAQLDQNVSIILMDLQGVPVIQEKLYTGTTYAELNTEAIPPGMYVVLISQNNLHIGACSFTKF